MTTTKDYLVFVERRQLWIECLSGEDPNSVCNQLYQMIWNAAAYRIVNEARRLAPPAKEGGVQLNGMMHRLIDSCFWDSQVLAVRRLMDIYPIEKQDSKRRDKSVFSLTGLLQDMEHHVHFLTRGNILAAEGLEYDTDAVRRKEDAYCREQIRAGNLAFFVPREVTPRPVEERHQDLDSLTGTLPQARKPADCIYPAFFKSLGEKVSNACATMKAYALSFKAHSATPASRLQADTNNIQVTLLDLWKAHESLCRTAQTISAYVLGTGSNFTFLAMPQGDHLIYIEKPLVSSDNVAQLRATWKKYEDEYQTRAPWEVSELL